MDRFQRSRSYSRPYQFTCGENAAANTRATAPNGPVGRRNERVQNIEMQADQMREGYSCRLPGTMGAVENEEGRRCTCLQNLPLAMAYVPVQKGIQDTYDLEDALRLGTLFPELCKPFCGCGKRGGGR